MLVDVQTHWEHTGRLVVPVSYTTQVVKGVEYKEPFWDYALKTGAPFDFGFDNDVDPGPFTDTAVYNVSPADFAETALKIPIEGKIEPFSLAERPYLRPVYDTPAKRRLLMWGRQSEKSTTLGNLCFSYCCLNNAFRVLYVSASAEQSKTFSQDRLADVIEISPLLQAYTNSKLTDAIFHKRFVNHSSVRLRYAYLNADRTRGITADLVLIDEIQDILTGNIPVIEECASHSDWKIFCYSGTPKSLDNTIEHYWSNFSTQNEWVVPCDRHGTPKDSTSWHWNILGEKNIGKEGLVCDVCKKPIDPYRPEAQWAELNPITESNKHRVTYEGYHIPQLMVPWILNKDWSEILRKQEKYPRAQFHNEVLGRSYDSGDRPITRAQLRACCREEVHLGDFEHFKTLGRQVFAGIDWGSAENTYTVIALGAYIGTGNFSIFWTHRFTGHEAEPDVQLDVIRQIITGFQVHQAGCDYGGGFDRNAALIKTFGPGRILKYQYNNLQRKAKIYWEPALGRFMVHRSEVMSDVFNALCNKQIDLPNWEDFRDPYGNDILSIFREYNERTRISEYKHSPGKTDDTFHAILYCLLASMIANPRPDIIAPLADAGQRFVPEY